MPCLIPIGLVFRSVVVASIPSWRSKERMGLGPGRLPEQRAQVDEMLLCCRALLQLGRAPLGDELARSHGVAVPIRRARRCGGLLQAGMSGNAAAFNCMTIRGQDAASDSVSQAGGSALG